MKISIKFFVFLLSLGFIPLTTQGFGYNFLPSMEWISTTKYIFYLIALLFVIFLCWFLLVYCPDNSISVSNRLLAFVVFLVFGCISGTSFVVVSIPLAMALASDHEVELTYTVASAVSGGEKNCSSPVEMRDMPFFLNHICNVTEPFRKTLTPGTKLAITGRGTSFGIFVRNMQIMKGDVQRTSRLVSGIPSTK